MPDTLVSDAGYGSEENYEYLENNDVEAFVKYQYFHKEQSKKWKDDPLYRWLKPTVIENNFIMIKT
jgi:hypothetical protein